MSLRGIDISDYQAGLDLDKIDYDFMICKATEGTSIVHKTCDPFIQKAIKAGKLWGFYHFMNKEDPVAQANYFYKNCKNYFGHGIPVLDYEMYGRIGTAGAKKFLDRIYELTGVRCMVYMSRSVCVEEDWSAIAPNHALWVAQYANNNPTGYQDDPWFPSGSIGAFKAVTIHQYTSSGRLNGYNGNLDLDIAYLTRDGWMRIANPGDTSTSDPDPEPSTPSTAPSGTVAECIVHIFENGLNGDARKNYLGNRYDEVQNAINHLLQDSVDKVADYIINKTYGELNGEDRKLVLGNRYDAVQDAINKKLGVGQNRSYTVKSGDSLWGIGQKLGIDWVELANKNGIKSPYTIYPGQKLVY